MKHTRKHTTPGKADHRPFRESAFSGVLRFRVCFGRLGALLEENNKHPKTQQSRNRRFWERSMICVFGCVAFSGVLWRQPKLRVSAICTPESCGFRDFRGFGGRERQEERQRRHKVERKEIEREGGGGSRVFARLCPSTGSSCLSDRAVVETTVEPQSLQMPLKTVFLKISR